MIKYNFVFDQDAKQILYYDKQDTGAINSMLGSKTFIILLWGGIFILIIIIGFLSYILYRLIKERKKDCMNWMMILIMYQVMIKKRKKMMLSILKEIKMKISSEYDNISLIKIKLS